MTDQEKLRRALADDPEFWGESAHICSLLSAEARRLQCENDRLTDAFSAFVSKTMTCKKTNTPGWMESLARHINEACAALGSGDRVKWAKWASEFQLEIGNKEET